MPTRSLGPLTGDRVVARARSAIGHGIGYELGKGGRDPYAPLPSAPGLTCDCSGFAAWCVGRDRYLPNVPGEDPYAWFETSNIVKDAKRADWPDINEVLWQDALPGDLLVWGDTRGVDGRMRQGHIGIVASLGQTGPETVVHCSVGNDRRTGDAIQETDAQMFARNNAIVARCAWVAPA